MSISNRSKHYNGTKNAMKGSALDMHFQAPPPLSKMCFEYPGIIFNGKKVLNFSQMLMVRPQLNNSISNVAQKYFSERMIVNFVSARICSFLSFFVSLLCVT